VLYRSATHRAQRRSSSFPSVVESREYVSVKVLILLAESSAASTVDKLESSPPLKKNPIGTSESNRRCTPCLSRTKRWSVISVSVIPALSPFPEKSRSQYRRIDGSRPGR